MRLTWKTGLHLAAAGSAITLVTMIGSVPVSASPGGHPGPAGLLPALRGHSSLTNGDDPGGEGEDILDSAQQYAAVRTAENCSAWSRIWPLSPPPSLVP